MAVWTLVLVTVERLLAVTIPHKAKILVTKKRAAYSVVILFLIFLPITIPIAWIVERAPLYSSETGRILTYRCFLRGNKRQALKYVFNLKAKDHNTLVSELQASDFT